MHSALMRQRLRQPLWPARAHPGQPTRTLLSTRHDNPRAAAARMQPMQRAAPAHPQHRTALAPN